MMRWAALLCCGILALACDRGASSADPAPSAAPAADAPSPASPTAESSGASLSEAEVLALIARDSLHPDEAADSVVRWLEAVLDTATTEPYAAPAMLRLALLRIRRFSWVEDSLQQAHPRSFVYLEPWGRSFYSSADLDTLIARFPRSPLVDDARYALTLLEFRGYCEGDAACTFSGDLGYSREFLAAHPTSPYAGPIIAEVNRRIRDHLLFREQQEPGFVRDLRVEDEGYDPASIRSELEGWQQSLDALPRPTAAPGLILVADLWSRFGEPARARVILERISTDPGSVPPDSIRVRLEQLP